MRRGFPVALNLAPPVWRMLTAPLRSNGLRSVGTKADVTKGDLIQILREKGDISKTKAREALDALLQKIMLVVSTGGKATVSGFGTFKWTLKSARAGVNPRTREKIHYPSRPAPRFIPSKVFKQKLHDNSTE